MIYNGTISLYYVLAQRRRRDANRELNECRICVDREVFKYFNYYCYNFSCNLKFKLNIPIIKDTKYKNGS